MAQTAPSKVVRAVRRGQITIPIEFRRRLGIDDDSLLQLTLQDNKIEITPVIAAPAKDAMWARELYELFAPARADLETLSQAELDTLIDEALADVQAGQDGQSDS